MCFIHCSALVSTSEKALYKFDNTLLLKVSKSNISLPPPHPLPTPKNSDATIIWEQPLILRDSTCTKKQRYVYVFVIDVLCAFWKELLFNFYMTYLNDAILGRYLKYVPIFIVI